MHSFMSAHYYGALFAFLSLIFAGNIPIGFYRKRFLRFSRPWARCLYIPILANIILRRFFGLGYDIIPFTILVVFAGQFIGARIGRDSAAESQCPESSVSD